MGDLVDRPPAPAAQEPAPMSDTSNQTVEPPVDPKGLSLMQVLSTTDQGNVASELNSAWNGLIRTLRDLEVNEGVRKSKGSLTIKLGVEYEDGTIRLKVEETLKTPKAPQRAAVFWVTGDGRVTAENPRQMSMFRDVPRRTVTVL
jgi:hypothetical protein